MKQPISKRYAGYISLGLIFLWGSSIVMWINWTQSDAFLIQFIGVVGVLLSSASGLATFLYIDGLEKNITDLK